MIIGIIVATCKKKEMTEAANNQKLQVSVCVDCARHSSLKKIITDDLVTGICAFCCRTNAQVRNPDNIEPMVMMMRALIRFYWDEFSYNSHWGGEEVLKLFDDADNPVVKPFAADDYYYDFDHLLQHPLYPEWNKGVSIYAGHDANEMRMWNSAISRSTASPLGHLRRRLNASNFATMPVFWPWPRFFRRCLNASNFATIKNELGALIKPFLDDLTVVVPKGKTWFRARTGVEDCFLRVEGGEGTIVRQPYMGTSIGASPNPGNGRLNRQGRPVLYLGSDPYTALAEIRPHPGHYVSIGGFEILQDLNVADFDPDISFFSASDERLEMYWIIHTFDRWMSTPVTPDDKVSYLITQLLAEILQAKGFHAVRFRSSVSEGVNLCIFDTTHAAFVEGHSKVNFVQRVHYEESEHPSVTSPEPDDYPLSKGNCATPIVQPPSSPRSAPELFHRYGPRPVPN